MLLMYKQAQPDVDIEINRVPWESQAQWITTNLAGGTLPDLLFSLRQPTTEQEATDTSPWLNWDPWLDQPSPYSPSARWRDDLDEGMVGSAFYAGLKHQYAVPVVYGCSGWAYNKRVFEQAGLDPEAPPDTWAELIGMCEILKEKQGELGIDAPMGNAVVVDRQGGSLDWPVRLLADVVAYQPWEKITGGEERFPTYEEQLQAYYDGTTSYCTPELKQMWGMIEQLVSYWPEGALGMAYEDQIPLFLQGRCGMLMTWISGLRDMDEATREKLIDWEYGTFGWPTVTAESNPFPMNKPNPVDGGWARGSHVVPADRAGKPVMDLITDFAQWFTSADISDWYASKVYYVPGNINSKGSPKLRAFYKGDPHARRGLLYLDKIKWFNFFQSWIIGEIGYEEYCKDVDEVNRMEAERLAGEVGLELSEESPF